jgi:hypothetical protein
MPSPAATVTLCATRVPDRRDVDERGDVILPYHPCRAQVQQAVADSGLGDAELVQDSITLEYAALNAEDVLVELLPAGLTVRPSRLFLPMYRTATLLPYLSRSHAAFAIVAPPSPPRPSPRLGISGLLIHTPLRTSARRRCRREHASVSAWELSACSPIALSAQVPTGHEEIGHVLHLNLRDEHKPYRHLIGHVLLDKVQRATASLHGRTPLPAGLVSPALLPDRRWCLRRLTPHGSRATVRHVHSHA